MSHFPFAIRSRVAAAVLVAVTLSVGLSACAPLIVGGAVGGALVAVDRRTSGAQLDDQGIELRGGESTVLAYEKVNQETIDRHIEFIKSLENYYIDEENRLFVHAGFTNMNGVTFEYFPKLFSWDRSLWETALALDKKMKKDDLFYPKRLTLYKEIYIGHTPVSRINQTVPVQMANVLNTRAAGIGADRDRRDAGRRPPVEGGRHPQQQGHGEHRVAALPVLDQLPRLMALLGQAAAVVAGDRRHHQMLGFGVAQQLPVADQIPGVLVIGRDVDVLAAGMELGRRPQQVASWTVVVVEQAAGLVVEAVQKKKAFAPTVSICLFRVVLLAFPSVVYSSSQIKR